MDTDTCNKDDRKGVSESTCCRKSSGLLVAVTPCLQIAAVRPMYASESLTPVLIFVSFLLGLIRDLQFVLYDNACGMVRHMRKQLLVRQFAQSVADWWNKLAALKWVIDRLHWTYHRGN